MDWHLENVCQGSLLNTSVPGTWPWIHMTACNPNIFQSTTAPLTTTTPSSSKLSYQHIRCFTLMNYQSKHHLHCRPSYTILSRPHTLLSMLIHPIHMVIPHHHVSSNMPVYICSYVLYGMLKCKLIMRYRLLRWIGICKTSAKDLCWIHQYKKHSVQHHVMVHHDALTISKVWWSHCFIYMKW